MTEIDIHDLSVLVRDGDSPLSRAHRAGVVSVADVQLARSIARMFRCTDELFMLTTALAFAAVRGGSSLLDLATAQTRFIDAALEREELTTEEFEQARQRMAGELEWPEPAAWVARLAGLSAVGDAASAPNSVPLRVVDTAVYLERYWLNEEQIADLLHARQLLAPPAVDEERLTQSLERLFPDEADQELPRLAVERAVRSWTSVLAGGPGTGKTTTVARIISALHDQGGDALRVALAAPSGKAASRMTQAISEQAAHLAGHLPELGHGQTLHRLLGAKGVTGEYNHGPLSPLPHDVVIVDEVSMVDLHQFGVLLSAVRPDARLVLVGDPQQLKSVNAGSVLADVRASGLTIGGGSREPAVTELTRGWRNQGDIHDLAEAIRRRDADAAMGVLASSTGAVRLDPTEISRHTTWDDFPEQRELVLEQWQDVVTGAEGLGAEPDPARLTGVLAALDRHRVLCAHRDGPHGVSTWTNHTLKLLRQWRPGFGMSGEFYPGRPIILTANDRVLDLSNGDTGVVVDQGGSLRVVLGDTGQHRLLSPALLRGCESVFALTVHKGQGSQFEQVTLVLPPLGSPLLVRDLVYTAVTRAKEQVTILGNEDQLRAAIQTESRRASGLSSRWRRAD